IRNLRVVAAGSKAGLLLRIASAFRRNSLTGSTSPSASGVRVIRRPTCTISGSWKASLNRASAPLVADWLRCKRSPARETLFSTKSASSATSRFRSNPLKSINPSTASMLSFRRIYDTGLKLLQSSGHGERLCRCFRVNSEQSSHHLRSSAARHSAFGGDAEIRCVFGCGRDAFLSSFGSVTVNQTQEKLGFIGKLKVSERLKVCVIGAVDGNGHMNVCNGTAHSTAKCVSEFHQFSRVHRFDEMLRFPVAIAQMKTKLDALRNSLRNSLHPRHYFGV